MAQEEEDITLPPETEAALLADNNVDDWVLDSGTSITMTNNEANLIDSILSNARIRTGGGFIFAKARGTCRIRVVNGNGTEVIQFSDTLYVPNIPVNLISTTRLKKKGLFYYIEKDYLYTRIHADKRILADVIERNNLP